MGFRVLTVLRFIGDPTRIRKMLDEIAYQDRDDIPEGVNSLDLRRILPPPEEDVPSTWYRSVWWTPRNTYGYESIEPAENTVSFFTDECTPHSIVSHLSERFPDIAVEHFWADERIGPGCGRRVFLRGDIRYEYIPDSHKDCIDLAGSIWEQTPADRDFVINAMGTDYIYMESKAFELIEVQGQTGLFTNQRLTPEDVPKGHYLYHIRGSDDGGGFATIEPKVPVNHSGSVILPKPLDFNGMGYIAFTDETYPTLGIGMDFD